MTALTDADRHELLGLAEAAIRSGLERRPVDGLRPPASAALNELGASFVTLERGGDLLGCIGTIEPVRPLYEDVMQNAYKAAFADPRLPPVTAADYAEMTVKVSVLSPLEVVPVSDRASLLGALRPGTDGLLLDDGIHRATFLPAVWVRIPTADEFVDLLLRKAALPQDVWPPDMLAWRYATDEFADPGPRSPLSLF